MIKARLIIGAVAFLLASVAGFVAQDSYPDRLTKRYPDFQVEVLVNGRPLAEYYARGRTYIEAIQGAEYALRVRNSSPERVAVALSVDGLNTVDARHTSAWNASKWVIEPYQTITISGWQVSSERARRFYFTNERDSYGAKLGQTDNLGVISAVFFREKRRVIPVTPRPITRDKTDSDSEMSARAQSAPRRDDAATGIGRNVEHDVRWVDMDLDSRAAGEVTIRYEYRWQGRDRDTSRGFCPEPRN
jgi:hypothetical protein